MPQRFPDTSLTEAESLSLAFFAYPPALAEKMRRRYWNSLGGFQGVVPSGLEAGVGGDSELRPICSAAQHVRFEESVLVDDWRYARQSDGLYERLYNVRTDPFERFEQSAAHPGIADCLNLMLRRFRNIQLGYYARPDFVRQYFPPRHRLAPTMECAQPTTL